MSSLVYCLSSFSNLSCNVPDDCVYLSGLDILDGTPVLDIKPYIPQYDDPSHVVSDPKTSVIQDPEKYGHLGGNTVKKVPLKLLRKILFDMTVASGSQHNYKPKMVYNAQICQYFLKLLLLEKYYR